MKLRTYQAYTMAEALAAVKRDLGADAVILNTRSFVRRTLMGLRRKTIVEVTATPADEARPRRPAPSRRSAPASPTHAAAKRAYDGAASARPPIAESAEVSIVTDEDRERTRRLAMAMAAQFDRKEQAQQTAAARDDAPRATDPPTVRPGPPASVAPKLQASDQHEESPSRRFVLVPSEENGKRSSGAPPVTSNQPAASQRAAEPPAAPTESGVGDSMNDELAAIKAMVGQVLAQQSRTGGKAPALPPNLFEHYLNLVAQDISEELAEQIVNEVRDALAGEELDDASRVREAVAERLASLIPCSAEPVPIHSPDGRPLTIALVGPTGVGKTTTLAKLAATFKLQHRKKVGLITSDTYRIAAVDQLRTYANIIGLPLHVALTPAEMERAVHQLSACDVILVDTAGRSQNDELRIEELRQFIGASGAHEVHLVLSSTASEKVLLREAEAFSRVGVHKIVLTKLDEAVSFGMLINVIRTVGKELSFVTTGQEVPDHIEAGRPQKLADLILGGTLRS